jgi:hypothetical protein
LAGEDACGFDAVPEAAEGCEAVFAEEGEVAGVEAVGRFGGATLEGA